MLVRPKSGKPKGYVEPSSPCYNACLGVTYNAFTICLYLAIGTAFYWWYESKDLSEAFYFSAVSMTTVGFGDVLPTTPGGRYFAIPYLLIGCFITARAMCQLASIPLDMRRKRMEDKIVGHYGNTLDNE